MLVGGEIIGKKLEIVQFFGKKTKK